MQGPFPEIDYLVLGPVTEDLTPAGPMPGGTVTFGSLTVQGLGLRPGFVTSIAGGKAPELLSGFPSRCLPAEQNTTFENVYTPAGRVQYIRGIAGTVHLADVPLEWRSTPVVHLAPLAQDVDVAMVGQFPGSFVGLTPQGWMRRWDSTGRVTAAIWPDAEYALGTASAVVISREDVNDDAELIRTWADWAQVLVVTAGPEGATVYSGGQSRRFPAPRVREVDPTGAGDIFAAVYFSYFQAIGDPWEAAKPAVAVASASVERAGLESIPAAAHAVLGDRRLK